jgi:hypothetical protein
MMSEQMTDEKVAALRKPFDKKSVGKLPKGGAQLDYVGHAAVTDRLLAIDPLWSWEPMATDERGLPITDAKGNLWIRLTICGVTRIGVGDGPSAKVVIGDAIRNAAMRFGVALDLWSKEELESVDHGEVYKATAADNEPTTYRRPPAPPPPDEDAEPAITPDQLKTLQTLASKLDMSRETRLAGLTQIAGRPITTANDLLFTEASAAIKSLAEMVRASEAVADELPVA